MNSIPLPPETASHERDTEETRRSADLLRNTEGMRKEIARLRAENTDLLVKFTALATESQTDRDFRRAALNLMEDAVRSRKAAYDANDERRRVESKLEETIARRTLELRETVSELEAFSYSIAHDMRAPLRTMRGYGELLIEQYSNQLDAVGLDYVRRISASAERMDRLIQDVLNYSKIVRTDFQLECVDIGSVLRGIIESYPHLSGEHVTLRVEEPLLKVMGSSASLMQCLSNLLDNAVKFVPPGTKAEVRVWSESRGSSVRLSIKDNGIGIDPEQHEKIFGIFEQLDTMRGGTGVGLAIVKKSVERMGGKLGVESALGQGSTFWIELREGQER